MFSIRHRIFLIIAFFSITASALAQMPMPAPMPIEPSSPSLPPFPPFKAPMPTPMPSPMPAPLPGPADVMPSPMPPAAREAGTDTTALYRRIIELYEAGRYGEAVPVADEYARVVEEAVGATGLAYARAMSIKARLHQALGGLELAEPLLRASIAIHEGERGSEQSDVANDLDALAQICQETGRLDEAEILFKRALALHERTVATEPANLGRSLNNLAWLYQEQGRYADAEPLMKKAIEIIRGALGPKDPDYGRALDTLAKINEGRGSLSEAASLYQQAMAILQESLGPDHESVAVTAENLGGLLKAQGRLEQSEILLTRALAIKEATYGAIHPRVANVLAQLGDLYRQQGKGKEAQQVFGRALSIRKANVREVPVFFATDRKREEENAETVTFGVERGGVLSFGRAMVIVSKPDVIRNPAPLSTVAETRQAPHNLANLETTEVSRLAIREITTSTDSDSFMQAALKRLDNAEAFPKQVFVFVHGYNVSFENALRRTAQIAYDLNFDSAPFLFSWPSRSSLWSYTSDRESAEIAVNHLKEFLEKLFAEAPTTKVHLIAHSMGNVVLLSALEKIALRQGAGSRLKFSEIVMHSPDVDQDRFNQVIRVLKDLDANFTLYASTSDRALSVSGWLWGVVGRAGAVRAVVPGVETIDVTEAGSSFLGLNHDLYATNPTIFSDMRHVLQFGEHPPDKRSTVFEPRDSGEGVYWHYSRSKALALP
jgi:esterase/lipase superfamily enzyme